MRTYLLSLVLAALAASHADIPSPPAASLDGEGGASVLASRLVSSLAPPEDPDDNTIAFVTGIIPGLICPMHGPNISGKVALAPVGWWGRGAGHHIMIDVTYGCLQGCTWLVREHVSQPEPEQPGGWHRLPPRAERVPSHLINTIGPGACVYTVTPASAVIPYQGGNFSTTVNAVRKNQ